MAAVAAGPGGRLCPAARQQADIVAGAEAALAEGAGGEGGCAALGRLWVSRGACRRALPPHPLSTQRHAHSGTHLVSRPLAGSKEKTPLTSLPPWHSTARASARGFDRLAWCVRGEGGMPALGVGSSVWISVSPAGPAAPDQLGAVGQTHPSRRRAPPPSAGGGWVEAPVGTQGPLRRNPSQVKRWRVNASTRSSSRTSQPPFTARSNCTTGAVAPSLPPPSQFPRLTCQPAHQHGAVQRLAGSILSWQPAPQPPMHTPPAAQQAVEAAHPGAGTVAAASGPKEGRRHRAGALLGGGSR